MSAGRGRIGFVAALLVAVACAACATTTIQTRLREADPKARELAEARERSRIQEGQVRGSKQGGCPICVF